METITATVPFPAPAHAEAKARRTRMRSPSRLLTLFATAMAATSCATSRLQPLNGSALRASRPRTLVVVRSTAPSFVAMNFGTAGLGGWLGVLAYGQSLVGRDGIDDPAGNVGAEVAHVLSSRYALQEVSGDQISPKATWRTRLAIASRLADLVLDVRTADWGFSPTGKDGGYRVSYSGTLRLIDARSGGVLAEGSCTSPSIDPHGAPSHDELLADSSAVLKAMLTSAGEACVDVFRSTIIGVD